MSLHDALPIARRVKDVTGQNVLDFRAVGTKGGPGIREEDREKVGGGGREKCKPNFFRRYTQTHTHTHTDSVGTVAAARDQSSVVLSVLQVSLSHHAAVSVWVFFKLVLKGVRLLVCSVDFM